MLAVRTAIFACVVLAACDGNPFVAKLVDDGTTGNPSVSTLSGTTDPSETGPILRTEVKGKGPQVGGTAPDVRGNGFAEGYVYDPVADTFTVDNLAFDGGNTYQRSTALRDVGIAQVYEAASTYADPDTGANIDQLSYRALYGVSTSGRTSFAIVRTGSYLPYGFGGFMYQRKNGVVLPTAKQAKFSGDYAGIRDFDGAGGLQYTTGRMNVEIDFDDFKGPDGKAIKGTVDNRRIFDLDGNNITNSVLTAINADKGSSLTRLPNLLFSVGPGNLDLNGELEGEISSGFVDDAGNPQDFEAGKYYAVISGDKADEMVGIIVVTSGVNGVTARETGGFILYRP